MAGPRRPRPSEISFLASTAAFGELSADEIVEVCGISNIVEFSKGSTILERGSRGNAVYAIISGRVDILTLWPDGREMTLNIQEAGQVFGEIAALDGKERTASAVCAENARLLRITRPNLIEFLNAKPGRWQRMVDFLCQRIRWTSDRIEATVFLDTPRRLAHQLIILARSFGKPTPEGIEIDANFTQDELARMIGVSREGVNKSLRHLAELRIIQNNRGRILVASLAILQDYIDGLDD